MKWTEPSQYSACTPPECKLRAPASVGGLLATDVVLRQLLLKIPGLSTKAYQFVVGKVTLGLFGGLITAEAFAIGIGTGYGLTIEVRRALDDGT